jgi:hypothetical protein
METYRNTEIDEEKVVIIDPPVVLLDVIRLLEQLDDEDLCNVLRAVNGYFDHYNEPVA